MNFPPLVLGEWCTGRAPVDELTDIDRRLAANLRDADGGRLIVDERRDGTWISTRSWVGVVRFTEFEVRVVPKVAGGNIGVVRMLDYATGIDALKRIDALRALDTVGDSLLELIAWLFADACDQLLRDGLLSDYVAREDSLHVLRGKLQVLSQVQRHFGQVDPLEVAFDDYESDIPENQIIAAALKATRPVVNSSLLKRRVRRLHSIFLEAADPTSGDALVQLGELAYTRKNERYRIAHLLGGLLLRRLAVRDLFTPGGTSSFAFLLDMNALFEDFVGRLVSDVFQPRGIRVHSQRRDPSIILDDNTGKRYAAIIPDLLLEARTLNGRIRLPVDAKYKLYDQRKLDESDVYQTFFYAFAYAPEGAAPARAVILYPRSPDGTDTSLRVDSHVGRQSARIQAFGLDIAAVLDVIARGRPTIASVPSLGRLSNVFNDVVTGAAKEAKWLAS